MNRIWQKALGATLIGITLAMTATGCMSRPAPRREPTSTNPNTPADPGLGTAVTRTAAGVGGAGDVESIVLGSTALIALQLNNPNPGGMGGGPVGGTATDPNYPRTSAGGGPKALQGPGGSIGTSPAAMPGGGSSPGASIPGGTPNYTHAVPNAAGSLMTQTGGSGSPATGAVGNSPMDVMHRVANLVRAKHPTIAEVRFAATPADARRVAEIAGALRDGRPWSEFSSEVNGLRDRAIPAGTADFPATHPAQGTTPRR